MALLSLYMCPEDFLTEGPSLPLIPSWQTLQKLGAEVQLTLPIRTEQDPGTVLEWDSTSAKEKDKSKDN